MTRIEKIIGYQDIALFESPAWMWKEALDYKFAPFARNKRQT